MKNYVGGNKLNRLHEAFKAVAAHSFSTFIQPNIILR